MFFKVVHQKSLFESFTFHRFSLAVLLEIIHTQGTPCGASPLGYRDRSWSVYRYWTMVKGLRVVDLWVVVYGKESMDSSLWVVVYGLWVVVYGLWVVVYG